MYKTLYHDKQITKRKKKKEGHVINKNSFLSATNVYFDIVHITGRIYYTQIL